MSAAEGRRRVGVAVAEAGKHVWAEKPLGLTTGDAGAVADAAVFVPERARPSAATLDAMAESAGTGTWVEVAAT